MPWVIGVVVILGLGFVMWSLYKKMTSKPTPPVVQTIIYPPYVVAERLLNELKAKQLWQRGQYKEYYSELTHILRGYIEEQFNIPALENTTDELVVLLEQKPFNSDVIHKIKGLLQTADLVKFAKMVPPETLHEPLWISATDIVNQTKPKPIEPLKSEK